MVLLLAAQYGLVLHLPYEQVAAEHVPALVVGLERVAHLPSEQVAAERLQQLDAAGRELNPHVVVELAVAAHGQVLVVELAQEMAHVEVEPVAAEL